MRQDHTGCRRVALEGGLGCLVVILSLLALILFGLRGEREGSRESTPIPEQRDSQPAEGNDLRDSLEDALRESGVDR